ncbi:hypothetical protein DFH09DRAFT_1433737 [Mycena vulgaris]|nr:hypothetical protein DFH09DRAFT_1433737 [Mycena vulgaris]
MSSLSRATTDPFPSTPTETSAAPPAKKRKAQGIDAAAAPHFLAENFDLETLANLLGVERGLLTDSLLAAVKNPAACTVRSSQSCSEVSFGANRPRVLGFASVEERHLKPLRELGTLKFKANAVAALVAQGKEALASFAQYREQVADVVWPRVGPISVGTRALTDEEDPQVEAGCRMLIDGTLVPAVHAAQKIQEHAPLTIVSEAGARDTAPDDHIMIVPEWNIYRVPVEGEGQDVDFHGPLDYALVIVDDHTYRLVKKRAAPMPPRNNASLLTIVEAKSPVTMEAGRTQIEAQCLALLKDTGRGFFSGALTNGTTWIFFVAVANEKSVTIHEGPSLYTGDGEDDALVVGTLIGLIRHPGIAPAFCEFKRAM